MPSLVTHMLVASAYGLAAAAAAVVISQIFGFSGPAAWLAGGGLFLLAAQLHGALSRLVERGFMESEFADLRRTHILMNEELERTRGRVGDLSEALARESQERKQAHATERKVVEELVERTLAAVADARAKAPTQAERAAEGDDEDSAPPPVWPGEADILATVREAVEQNRIDVYLQPIVSLPQRRLRFYEAYSRLRDSHGEELPAAAYIATAERAGLVSSIDSLLTFRCVQILRKLTVKQRTTAIFCNISPHSLRDLDFFPQFLDYLARNRDLRNHLIFELPQETVANAMDTEKRHIARLGALGFALSLDRVETLELDLADLRDKNFRYVKIQARMLMDLLRAGEAADKDGALDAKTDIRAEDFKELLGRFGIDLIAEKLETESQVVEILDLHVDYGQGYLFGAPRPTREEDREAPAANLDASDEAEDQPLAISHRPG